MPTNNPPPNPPTDGYEEGLESYLFKPFREAWIKILQEATNVNSVGYFDHVAQWLEQPHDLEEDEEFPTIYVLTPSGDQADHAINQDALDLAFQFEYYFKSAWFNITNEMEHFVERVLWLLMTNKSITFGKLNLCANQIKFDGIEFDYEFDGDFAIRVATVTATANIPLLAIQPP